ncbi:short transient receptor potential channel 4-like isoform X1 [Centruroides sculpturatus]|uniref:short transient receptor potential channel 4-like isoform X1 n=2 Tax=Centruroides sculpturatus TaxID=218467 RepID=UPI000C6DC7AA|nr:short transient receptor potential channel 4-like isoform X1 [Centruroides sculpturatus]
MENAEVQFFKLVENGNLEELKTFLSKNPELNINCLNFQGFSGLHLAINSELVHIVEFLISRPEINLSDCVLHAISVGNIEITTMILDALSKKEPDLEFMAYPDSIEFSLGLTPLLLAAQKGNIEIIRLLMKRNHKTSIPHIPTCLCRECKEVIRETGILDLTTKRLDIFKGICNPYYICLSSSDPILTAFDLDLQLKFCAQMEKEYYMEYNTLSENVRMFAVDLLSQCSDIQEVKKILKLKRGSSWKRSKYPRLQIALDYKQKEFVAHPSVQKIVTAEWNGAWTTFSKYRTWKKGLIILFRMFILPIVFFTVLLLPNSYWGKRWKCPLSRFLNELASYLIFLIFLFLLIKIDIKQSSRGPPSTGLEGVVALWIIGYLFSSLRSLCIQGWNRFRQYWWNIYSLIMELIFISTFVFWILSWVDVLEYGFADLPRNFWPGNDYTLIHEGLLCIAGIMAAGRLFYFFHQSSRLGPLQVSLLVMLKNVTLFLIVCFILLCLLAICMTNLYAPYREMKQTDAQGKVTVQSIAFTSIDNSIKSLFWTIFGLVDLDSTDIIVSNTDLQITDVIHHDITEATGQILFAVYHIFMNIIFINVLVAILISDFQAVMDDADKEWKFSRTMQCVLYFRDAELLPSPFNLFPNARYITKFIRSIRNAMKIKDPKLKKPVHPLLAWIPFCYVEDEEKYDDPVEYQELMTKMIQRYLRSQSLDVNISRTKISSKLL